MVPAAASRSTKDAKARVDMKLVRRVVWANVASADDEICGPS